MERRAHEADHQLGLRQSDVHMDKRHFGYVNDESDQLTYDEVASCDAMLTGRKTYDSAMGRGDTITLANPSPVVRADRVTHLLYEVDDTTKGGV